MDVETRNHTTTLANSRIPEMLGTFHLDDHNVQEWSDAIGHKARKEVGKWIDRDRNADVRFQRHEDSKQSEKSSEQQRTEVIQGNAPDAAFQIVRSQRKIQDADSGRVTTMSTSYQMSSSVGTRSTSKTTSNKTSTKTVTVSGGSNHSDDFESLGLTFQPLDTSTQRGRILISRSGTMGVRRPPTRRPTPVTITAVSPEPEEVVVTSSSSTKSNADTSSKLNEAQSYTVETFEDSTRTTASSESSRQINGHRDSHPSAFSVPTKNLSSKIRVGFPVEIQLELQSKFRYTGTEDEGPQPIIIESVDDDDDDGINSSPSPRDDGLGGSPDMTSSSSEDKLNEIRQSFASTNKQLSSSYKKTTTSSQDSAIDVLNGYSDNVYEHTNGFHESRKRDNKIIEHKITLAAASDSEPDEGAYDFARRRKSFGFESIDLRKNKSLSAFKNTNNNTDSNTSSRSSQIDLLHYSPKYVASSVLRRTPPSLSKSWDVLQGNDVPENLNGIDNKTNSANNTKRFSSSSTLNSHMDSNKLSSVASNGYNRTSANRLKVPQKAIVTVNGAPSTPNSSQENMLSNLIRDSDNFTRNKRNSKLSDLYRNESNLASSVTNLSFSVENGLDTVHNHQRSSSSSDDRPKRPAETIGAAMSKYVGKQNVQQEPSSSSFKKSLENFEKFGVFQKDWKRDQLRAGELTTLENDLEELNESLNKILQGDDLVSVYAKITPQIGKGADQQSRMLLSGSVERLNKERLGISENQTVHHHHYQDKNDLLSSSIMMDQHGKASNDNNSSKAHQISHTWISPVDQRPSQKVRDKDVTTTISATNDPSRKNSKKVEFCKTEVHFTPESGKFNIVESLEDKPPTVHLFRRRKNKDKNKGTSSSGGDGGLASELTTSTTPTPKTPTTDTSYEQGQNTESSSSSSSSSSSYLKNYHAITEELKSKLDASSSGSDIAAKSTQAEGPTTLPIASVGGGNEQSFFHPWNETNVGSRNDGRPQVVTPPLLEPPGHINSHQNINNNYISNTNNRSQLFSADSSNNITFKKELGPISASIRKDSDSVRKSTTLIQDTLDVDDYTPHQEYDQDDDGDDASGGHLNEYGQLKIQRYLKQLKTPSSVNGSEESTTDNFVDEDANDNDDEGTLSRQDNHILYENGSFIPSATRKSLIEMNNRNRKRTQHQSNVSDKSSSAASSYSLPHSERNYINNDHYVTNPFSSRLPTVEAIVSTKDVPKITSVDVRYNLYDDRPPYNDFFTENVTPNFRNAGAAFNNDSEDELQEPVEPVHTRSVPPPAPYFRSNSSYEDTYRPASPLLEDTSSKAFAKPPIPILPSQFANFEKTGAALRERSKMKSQSLAASRESNYSTGDSSRTSQHQTNKSIVNIGPAESDDFDTLPFEPSTRFESLSPNFNDAQQDSFEDSQQQEPILSLDHTWKGPAHFEHQNQLRCPSMTLPKSAKPEPEWVQKARSREARVTDWNLIGKPQQGGNGGDSKPDPPWLSELRTKTKPPTSNGVTIDEYGTTTGKPNRNAPPKQSWQKEPRVLTIPRVSSPESEAEPTYIFSDGRSKSTVITEIEEQQRNLYNEGVYMAPVNGHYHHEDRPRHYDPSSQLSPASQENKHYGESRHNTTKTTTTSAPSPVIGHREEDIIHYQEIQETEEIDPKLLAPLMETPKRVSRKPLHSNNINKRGPPELPKPRTLPRPPRPPERNSSLVRKTAGNNSSRYNPTIPPTEKKSASPLNKQPNPPVPACRSRLPSPRITPPREHPSEDPVLRPKNPGAPEFQHPCVQVAKIPKAGQPQGTLASAHKTKPPSPRIDAKTSHDLTSNSRTKAKNHVAVVNETKIMCNSKLLGGSNGGRAQSANPQPSTTTRTQKRPARIAVNNLAHKKR